MTVTDIEFDDLGNFSDRHDIIVVRAVAAMNFESQVARYCRPPYNRGKFFFARRARGIAICPGVDLDGVGADFAGSS